MLFVGLGHDMAVEIVLYCRFDVALSVFVTPLVQWNLFVHLRYPVNIDVVFECLIVEYLLVGAEMISVRFLAYTSIAQEFDSWKPQYIIEAVNLQ